MRLRRLILLVLFLGALVVAVRVFPFREALSAFSAWLARLGPERFVYYALAYALVAVLMGPAWLMTIAAGLLFGLWPGVAVVSAGSTLGAAAAFLVARHLARARVAHFLDRHAALRAVDRAVERDGSRIVFLLRLSPLVPYVFSNYAYGLTGIRFGPYVLASWLGMLPITILYASFGVAAGRAAGAAVPAPEGAAKWIVLGGGALVTALATAYAARVVRAELRRGGPCGRPELPLG